MNNNLDNKIMTWYETCCTCKKQKPNMPKARCQLYHAICVARSETALNNIDLFSNNAGVCKEFEAKGDSDGNDQTNSKSSGRKSPTNW